MSRRKRKDEDYLWVLAIILIVLMSLKEIMGLIAEFFKKYGVIVIICIIVIYIILSLFMEKKEFVKRTLSEIDKMTGVEFEDYLYAYFCNEGYRVEKTKAAYDYGADLILCHNNKRTVVQAKRYSRNVGISAIQEVNSSKSIYHADSAMVITNNYYTKSAINLAQSNGVELWNRDTLKRKAMISSMLVINSKSECDFR